MGKIVEPELEGQVAIVRPTRKENIFQVKGIAYVKEYNMADLGGAGTVRIGKRLHWKKVMRDKVLLR